MNRLKDLGLRTINSLWFFPGILTGLLAVLAVSAVAFDLWLDGRDGYSVSGQLPWAFSSSPEGARTMLGTIAGALITAAGVTFSSVLVALSVASSQYTSRILSSFISDRLNQFTVGMIIGAFVYCLVVLRTVGVGTKEFVPEVAVAIAILLGAGAVCLLVFFVHSVAQTIQASEILARTTEETLQSLRVAFREEDSDRPDHSVDDAGPETLERPFDDAGWCSVDSSLSGYLRTVDRADLVHIAVEYDVIVRMERAVGTFVHEGTPLLSYLSAKGLSEEKTQGLMEDLQAAHTIGSFRTVEQDPAFGVRQLVDIALRALSPGINDTTTAVMVIERITQLLLWVARRTPPSLFRYSDGQLRLCILRHDIASLATLGYDQIYESSRGNQAAIHALLQGWVELARVQPRGALADHLAWLLERVHRDEENERAFNGADWPSVEDESTRLRALLGESK